MLRANGYIKLFFCFLLTGFCLFVPQYASYGEEQGLPPFHPPVEKKMEGRDYFIMGGCVNCHTIGRGKFVGPDLGGVGKRYSRDEIITWITNPQELYRIKGKMPVNDGYPPMPPPRISEDAAEKIADYLINFKGSSQLAVRGTIKGSVTNGTLERPVGGLKLSLKALMGDKVTDERTVETNERGEFAFDDLGWDRGYVISVNYKGASYETGKLVFYPDEDTKVLRLPVYEPTDSDKDIRIGVNHTILQFSNDSLSVAEIVLLDNRSNLVYVGKEDSGGKPLTVRFSLPPGASDLTLVEGIGSDEVQETQEGFASTAPVVPGVRRYVYAYTLPLKGGRASFTKTLGYPVDTVAVIAPQDSHDIKVAGLVKGEPVKIGNEVFSRWTGQNIGVGTPIVIEIKTPFRLGEHLEWFAIGLVLILIVAGVVYSYMRSPGDVKQEAEREKEGTPLETERKKLIAEIAILDDLFEAGKLPQDEYEAKRRNLKEKAIELSAKIKTKKNDG
jgi:cytochrome c551/c552